MKCSKQLGFIIGISLVVLAFVVASISFFSKGNRVNNDNKRDFGSLSSAYTNNLEDHLDLFKTVNTDCGLVEGLSMKVRDDEGKPKTVYQFKNIPYAVPPVGKRRWRPPLHMNKKDATCWKGILPYNNKKIMCPLRRRLMGPIEGQEDCLVLDIRTSTTNKTANLPVFVWIHGGAMLWSHKEDPGYFPNPQFTASMNAVTVSINFRLNVFGFLSLEELWIKSGSEQSYGNYGLLDIIMSLKWIKENIKSFGGNANQVTLLGHSGGGTACYSLLASPAAKGLFHKVVSVSGSPNIKVNHIQANQLYRQFITKTSCHRNSSKEVRECLENLPVETALNNAPWIDPMIPGIPSMFTNLLTYKLYFPINVPNIGYPVEILDPIVVPNSPSDITSSQASQQIDIILSSVSEELPVFPPIQLTQDFNSLRDVLEPRIRSFKNATYDEIYSLYNQINSYTGSPQTPLQFYSVMGSDVLGNCITNDAVNHYSLLGYRSYRLVTSQPPTSINGKPSLAYHGWDMRVLFGFQEYPGYKATSEELILMKNTREVYKNFLHSTNGFHRNYNNKTIMLWENQIKTFKGDYHEKQCHYWKTRGFFTHSWGNLGR